MFVDVAFPLKLLPLTYKLSDEMTDFKGRIIQAPFRGRDLYGLILNESSRLEHKDIKEIKSIHEPFVSMSYLSLIKWLSDYYLNPVGNVLRSLFFEDTVTVLLKCKPKDIVPLEVKDKSVDVGELTPLLSSILKERYNTFLFHATSIIQERLLLKDIFNKMGQFISGGIILVPEIDMIEDVASSFDDSLKERVCFFHSKLTKKKRIESLNYILSGQKDIVIGTRSAVLAPLKNLSFIAVLGEQSQSYKAEEGIRYNARDVAVMRGFIERATVLLSSVCPSVESIYNMKIGKYHLLKMRNTSIQRPRVKVIDSRELTKKGLTLSKDILKEARKVNIRGGDFLFLTNKKGYSFLRCEDCGQSVKCRRCKIAMTFYKSSGLIKCHYCGLQEKIPESCDYCKGFKISLFGAGVDKIKEELGKDFELKDMSLFVEAGYKKRMLKHLKFDGVAILNVDLAMAMPDFRSRERLFQDFIYISEKINPDGTIFIQSSNPKDKMFRFMKDYDFRGFYDEELLQRKELNYPPFSKIVLLNIFLKTLSDREIHEIEELIHKRKGIVEILGPLDAPQKKGTYEGCLQIFFKANNRKQLHKVVTQFLDEIKGFRGLKLRVDVDPVKI